MKHVYCEADLKSTIIEVKRPKYRREICALYHRGKAMKLIYYEIYGEDL